MLEAFPSSPQGNKPMTVDVYGWNNDLKEAPSNKRMIVINASDYCDTWAVFDSEWGNGRGAWFNDKGHAIKVIRWQTNSAKYLATRHKLAIAIK